MNKKTVKILICDLSLIFSRGLASLLKEQYKVSEVYNTSNVDELIDLISKKYFNVVIIEDVFVSGIKSLIMSKIKKLCPIANIIVTSDLNEVKLAEFYISRGVKGFIPKSADDEIIVNTVMKVANNSTVTNYDITKKLKAINCRHSLEIGTKEFELSKKELEIMFRITEGKSNKLIAAELDITERTVEFHKTNIYKKTNSKSVADLVLLSIVSRLL